MSQFKFLAVVLLIKLNVLYITTHASNDRAHSHARFNQNTADNNNHHHRRSDHHHDGPPMGHRNNFDSDIETAAAATMRILSRTSSQLDDKMAAISNNLAIGRDDKIDDLFFDQQQPSTSATFTTRQLDQQFNEEKSFATGGGGGGGGGTFKPSQLYNTINLDNSIEEPEMFTNNHQLSSSYLPESPISSSVATQAPVSSAISGYNPRHYHHQLGIAKNPYHSQSYHSNYPYQSHNNYPGKQHPYPPNMFANNYNLNYIHKFLTNNKPTAPQAAATSQLLNIPADLLNANPNRLTLGTYGGSGSGGGGGFASAYISASSALSAAVNNFQMSTAQKQQQQMSSLSNHQYSGGLTDKIPSPPVASLLDPPQPEPDLSNKQSVNASIGDLPGSSICGRQQVAAYREPRVVGGNNTHEGEFPWAVSIQRHGNHHCGGVIVGKRWILTAAHCVRSQLVGNLIVRTGGHTLTRSANSLNGHMEKDYQVEQIVMHDDFSRYDNLTISQLKSSANTNNADIALLKLKHDILWNELAWPVCFPNREAGNFSGHDATVIGWGKLNEKSEEFSNELQKVKLTIIDNKVCQNWFRQAGRDMPIDDRIICAGFKSGGKDACHGDSGGPLLSRINGQYVVVGVVSTGIGCARPLLPGLYSRVSSYINWIERYITS